MQLTDSVRRSLHNKQFLALPNCCSFRRLGMLRAAYCRFAERSLPLPREHHAPSMIYRGKKISAAPGLNFDAATLHSGEWLVRLGWQLGPHEAAFQAADSRWELLSFVVLPKTEIQTFTLILLTLTSTVIPADIRQYCVVADKYFRSPLPQFRKLDMPCHPVCTESKPSFDDNCATVGAIRAVSWDFEHIDLIC